jgi:hypothetical protein
MARSVQRRRVEFDVPSPPPDPRPYVPAISLPGNRETAFLALHASACGFLMHWVNNQHVPHCREHEWCAGCKMGQTARWEGYLGVISLNTMNRFILRIPCAAFRESGLFRDKSDAGQLAGTVFTSFRFGSTRSRTNPAVIELVEQAVPMPRGNPFPLLAALARYWRMETLDVLDQVKRPEDAEVVLATEFVRYAKRVNAARPGRKERGS